MPVKVTKNSGGGDYRVSTPHGVKAKHATKKNAEAQKRLLNAVDHGWKPTHQHEAMRDDINTLPLSKEAKAYARRGGLKSMMNQPKAFMKVNAQITNPGKPNKVKNYEVGEQTDGKKGAPAHAFKESAAKIVDRLLTED